MKTDETKLMTNPDVRKKFLDALGQGVPIRVACMYARIAEQTFYNYMKRAEEGQSEYIDFIEEVNELLAKVQIKLVSEINNGKRIETIEKDDENKEIKTIHYEPDNLWTRKAWILERRFRKDWGKEAVDNTEKQEKITVILPSEYKTAKEWQKTNQE